MDVRWWQVVNQRYRQLTSRPAITPIVNETIITPVQDVWYSGTTVIDYYVPPWAWYLWIRLYHKAAGGEDRPYIHETRLVVDSVPTTASGIGTSLVVVPVDIIADMSAYRDSYVTLGFESRSVFNDHTGWVQLVSTYSPQTYYMVRAWHWYYDVGGELTPPEDPGPGPGVAPATVILVVTDISELPAASVSWAGARAIIQPGTGSNKQEEERKCMRGHDDVYRWVVDIRGGGPEQDV
jgi:hypothetical protein